MQAHDQTHRQAAAAAPCRARADASAGFRRGKGLSVAYLQEHRQLLVVEPQVVRHKPRRWPQKVVRQLHRPPPVRFSVRAVGFCRRAGPGRGRRRRSRRGPARGRPPRPWRRTHLKNGVNRVLHVVPVAHEHVLQVLPVPIREHGLERAHRRLERHLVAHCDGDRAVCCSRLSSL